MTERNVDIKQIERKPCNC